MSTSREDSEVIVDDLRDEVAALRAELAAAKAALGRAEYTADEMGKTLAATKGREERVMRLAWWKGRDHGCHQSLRIAEVDAACERDLTAIRAALAEKPEGATRPRGEAGDHCEFGNECGRIGCVECQQ